MIVSGTSSFNKKKQKKNISRETVINASIAKKKFIRYSFYFCVRNKHLFEWQQKTALKENKKMCYYILHYFWMENICSLRTHKTRYRLFKTNMIKSTCLYFVLIVFSRVSTLEIPFHRQFPLQKNKTKSKKKKHKIFMKDLLSDR